MGRAAYQPIGNKAGRDLCRSGSVRRCRLKAGSPPPYAKLTNVSRSDDTLTKSGRKSLSLPS